MGSTIGTGGLVAGHRLGAELGRGRDGVVFEAEHVALGRARAMKLLRPEATATAAATAALLAEARAAAAAEHPALVVVHDAGTFRRRPWIALGLVRGPSLRERLAAGPLTDAEVAALLPALASGLEALHAAGHAHRDVKPGNLLLEAGQPSLPVLVDFGRAAPLDASPSVDPACVADDVRGLALVAWGALAGGLPADVAPGALPALSARRPDLALLDEPLAAALAGAAGLRPAVLAGDLASLLLRSVPLLAAGAPEPAGEEEADVVTVLPPAVAAPPQETLHPDAPTPPSVPAPAVPVGVAVVPRRPRRRAAVGRVGPALAAALVALAAGGSWAGARLGTTQLDGAAEPGSGRGLGAPAGGEPTTATVSALPALPAAPAETDAEPTDDPAYGGELRKLGWRKVRLDVVRSGLLWRTRYAGRPGTRLVVERRPRRAGRYRGPVRKRLSFDTPGFGRVRGYAYDGGGWRRCTLPACVTVVATEGSGYVITVGARERDVAADEAVRAVRAIRP